MNTGQAPACRMALAVATKVSVEVSTQSPGRTPATISAVCSAAVPLTVATAWAQPRRLAMSVSKRLTKPPPEDTQLVSTHSRR